MSTTYQPRNRRHAKTSEQATPVRYVEWADTAPAEMRRAAGRKKYDAVWKSWTAWLAKRTQPKLPRLFRKVDSPMLIGTRSVRLETSTHTENALNFSSPLELLELLWRVVSGKRQAAKLAAEQLPSWLVEAEGSKANVDYALECLAWCYALPQLAQYTPPETWWTLFWHLLDTAAEGCTADAVVDPLAAALLGAELPLTLAMLLPEIEECRRATEQAQAWLRQLMTEHAADEVLFAVERLHLLQPTLACWTRSQAICGLGGSKRRGAAKIGLIPGEEDPGVDQSRAFRRLVLATMRWSAGDGGQWLSGHAERTPSDAAARNDLHELLQAAVKQDGSRPVRKAWDVFRKSKPKIRDLAIKNPCAGAPYEASCVAVLRSSWSRKAAALAVSFGSSPLAIEMTDGIRPLLSGAWNFEIRQSGHLVAVPPIPWDLVCWETNRRAQWLEVELDLADGLRIQRGMMLAPQDQFVLLMDAVVGPAGRELEYVARLPLASGAQVAEEKETRELTISLKKSSARVLPLAINEWRSDPRVGRLNVAEGSLELRQQSREGSLCAPLLIDYSRDRRPAPLTWRQLTIGEERRSVARDVAVGYRVQIGVEQWIIYRALSSVGNRTVLGQNLASEFKVGRFLPNGDVKTLMEIE
ncbi:MAG: hypothetical protein K8T91_16230 [Planctomycetes bacterium]|nr:hypothetical protein [Planctomycetota bacterium]